ncbi:MAG: hypothetical protein K2K20_04185 [Lachnospiraceae bacterium]|nr:hypothetical protein [Lachnospiraceae bacterium]
MISCPGCGQGMRFDPKIQMMYCDYCETKLEPDLVKVGTTASGNNEPLIIESKLFACPQCGGEILSDQDTAVTFCSFCGMSVELQGRTVQMLAPSRIIPFKCVKDTCAKSYAEFIKKAIFAPSYLREEAQLQKLRGIYMPYWTYAFEINDTVTYEGTTSHRSGDYIITDHYLLTATPIGSYDGISYDASSSFSDEISQAIGPFNIRDSKPFSVAYISGFYADTADVNAFIYEDDARSVIAKDIDLKIRKIPAFARYSISSGTGQIGSKLGVKAEEMAYFPVYFLANRHKNGLVSYAVINGQTGKVAADVPIDYKKYIIGSIILALPIMGILDLFLVLRPDALTMVAIVFAIISLLISNSELNQLYTRNLNLNDRGLLAAIKKRKEDERLREEKLQAELQAMGIGGGMVDSTVDSTVNSTMDGTVNSAMDGTVHSTVDSTVNGTVDSTVNGTVDSTVNGTVDSTVNGTVNAGNLSNVKSAEKASSTKALKTITDVLVTIGFMSLFVTVVGGGFAFFPFIIFAIYGILTIIRKSIESGAGSADNTGVMAKQPFKEKLPVFCKPFIAIVIGLLLLLIKPYQDEIYYAVSFVIMAVVIFSFSDVVKLHNKLTLRKPKQFNKRGGDENAATF